MPSSNAIIAASLAGWEGDELSAPLLARLALSAPHRMRGLLVAALVSIASSAAVFGSGGLALTVGQPTQLSS